DENEIAARGEILDPDGLPAENLANDPGNEECLALEGTEEVENTEHGDRQVHRGGAETARPFGEELREAVGAVRFGGVVLMNRKTSRPSVHRRAGEHQVGAVGPAIFYRPGGAHDVDLHERGRFLPALGHAASCSEMKDVI